MENTDRAKTVQKPCNHGLQNKKAMKSFDFTAFSGAMEGTRTPGLLIRSQSLYPAELPTHTFRSEHNVFYHRTGVLSTLFRNIFKIPEEERLFIHFSFIFYASALLCEGLGDADAGGRGGKTALTGLAEVGGE